MIFFSLNEHITEEQMQVEQESHRKSVVVDLQEQIDSIAPNKYFTQVAAAGSKGCLSTSNLI